VSGAILIPSRITKVTIPDLARALYTGHSTIMGSVFPSARAFAAALAQLLLECGNGEKSHDYDFHNEKLSAAWDGLYCQYACTEIFDARMTALAHAKGPCTDVPWKDGPLRLVRLPAEHPWSAFVAFESADEGAARYIEFLSCSDRYRQAWLALRSGDAAAFAHELRRAGYYTADEGQYTAGLVSIASRSLSLCDTILSQETPLFTPEQIATVTSLADLVIADTIWMHDRHHEELAA
jgi:hypothetical protein